MQMGKCLTWEDHWAASWKNFTSFHSTPSMRTAGTRPPDLPAMGQQRAHPSSRGLTPPATPGSRGTRTCWPGLSAACPLSHPWPPLPGMGAAGPHTCCPSRVCRWVGDTLWWNQSGQKAAFSTPRVTSTSRARGQGTPPSALLSQAEHPELHMRPSGGAEGREATAQSWKSCRTLRASKKRDQSPARATGVSQQNEGTH